MVVPRPGIVHPRLVSVRISRLKGLEQMIPILRLQVLVLVGWSMESEDVIFITHRPPNVAKCGETRNDISDIRIVVRFIHSGKTPVVVGMEEDDIRLDSHRLKILEAPFNVQKESRVEPIEIEDSVACLHVGKDCRLDMVIDKPLRKESEPYFREGAFA